MIGDEKKNVALAQAVNARGVFVVAFSFPVVPRGEARIRVQMSAAHTRGATRPRPRRIRAGGQGAGRYFLEGVQKTPFALSLSKGGSWFDKLTTNGSLYPLWTPRRIGLRRNQHPRRVEEPGGVRVSVAPDRRPTPEAQPTPVLVNLVRICADPSSRRNHDRRKRERRPFIRHVHETPAL